MAIDLIAKIAPKNDGFVGMVDADQVIGGGASGTLPDACLSESNITQFGIYASIRYVSVIRAGVLTEYPDPDDAFTAASMSGDIILVPPGTFYLSSGAILTADNQHIVGLGSPANCILSFSGDVGVLGMYSYGTGSSISDVTVNYLEADSISDRTALAVAGGSIAVRVWAYCLNASYGDTKGINASSATLYDCIGDAEMDGAGEAIGIFADDVTMYYTRAYARCTTDAGNAIAIVFDSSTSWIYYCLGLGEGTNGSVWGLQLLNGDGYTFMSRFHGDDYDVVIGSGDTMYVSDCQYDTANIIGTLTMLPGDKASKALAETITGSWTFEDDIVMGAGTTVDGIELSTHAHTGAGDQGAKVDHGNLDGLADDDHTQYLLEDGTRAMSGNLDMGANEITNVGNVDGVDVSDHSARHDVGGTDALTTTQGDVASEIVATDANKGIRPARLGVGVAVPGADGDGQLAGNVILSGAAKAVKGTGSVYPTLGTTTEAEKFGHAYLALTKDVYPDGETDVNAGMMSRFINKAGIAAYTHHRGTGVGIPAGCTLTATPSSLWAAWHAVYKGWFRGTYYQHYPNHASLPAGLTVVTGSSLGDTNVGARCHVAGSCNFGIWIDNYEVTRNYNIGEYIYRYDNYLVGSGPETFLYTQTATSVCTGGGIGAAATWAAWVNHAKSGPYGPYSPCGDGVVIRLDYSATTDIASPYVIGEQGSASGVGANQTMYDDAWPGSNKYPARRMGTFQRTQGYVYSAWDWYYLQT